MTAPLRILQGPQRPTRTLGEAVSKAGLSDAPLAVISAGWQEAEGDLAELEEVVGRPLIDLALYRHAERIFQRDPALRRAYRERQEALMALQRLYRERLQSLATAARTMLGTEAPAELLGPERRHAFTQLRALDRHHLARTEQLHDAFAERYSVGSHAGLTELAATIEKTLSQCSGVLLTGGNVLILLNRLQLFALKPMLADRPVIAWSAGAMVLSDRVVLYHDRAPGPARDAEILGAGVGLLPDHVFLPDGRRRLRNDDPRQIEYLNRRFAPASCVVLDNRSDLRFAGTRLVGARAARRLARSGDVRDLSVR